MSAYRYVVLLAVVGLLLGILLTLGLSGAAMAQTDVWTAGNGVPGDERIRAFAIDPSSPQTVYAGSEFNGVYKTTNGGTSWTRVNSGLAGGRIIALAIDLSNPQTVYAGSDNNGVYKTTNGGTSWTAVNAGLTTREYIQALAIDPSNPQTIYAGTFTNLVFKSTNGGTSWTAASTGLPLEITTTKGGITRTNPNQIYSLAIDPSNPQTIYAGTTGGVFKSTNGGTSWTAVNAGLLRFDEIPEVRSLAIGPSNPQTIYAGTTGDVFKSTNGGTSWTAANTGSTFFVSLAIDPKDPQTVYAGTNDGVYKTTNGGSSWTAFKAGLPLPKFVNALAIDPSNPQTVYAGTDAGLYKITFSIPALSLSATALAFDSTTVGATSQKMFTVSNTGTAALSVGTITSSNPQFTVSPAQFTVAAQAGTVTSSQTVTVTFSPTAAGSQTGTLTIPHNASGSPSTVALTGVGKAAAQPPPASNTWTAVNAGLTNTNVGDLAVDSKTPQTVYAGTLGGVFKSTNGGTAWTAVNTGLTNTSVSALAIDPSNPQTVYAGTSGGVFKTTNGGTSWTAVNTGLTSLSVNVLAIDPTSPQTVYAGAGSTVLKTTNGGTSWTAAATGLPGLTFTVFALAIDPKTPQTLYVSVRFRGVFKTTDGGTSWTAASASTGIPEGTQVYGLAVDPNTPQTVYAGSASGVFKTTNGGTAWTAVNTGLTNTGVISIEIDPSNPQTLYAGTDGGGVFRSTDGAATWSAVNAGLPDQTTVNAFAIDPSNTQTVYAGTGTGVYKFSYSAPSTQPPPTTTVPEPAKQDTTKLGVWLDLNTASGNQMVASGSALPGAEVTIQVFGRNLTSATSYGVTLGYDSTAVTFVAEKFKIGDYLPGAISLAPQVSISGGMKAVTFGAALLGGSPKSGSGLLGTVVFKVSDKFTAGYTEIKVNRVTLGTAAAAIQTSNAIVSAFKNAPPVAKFTITPDAIRAGDTKSLVTLDASGSSDPDGDPITVKWAASAGMTFKKSTSDTSRVAQVAIADSAKSDVSITLTVTDKNGAKTTATQTLKVIAPPSPTAPAAVDLDPAADNQNTALKYGVKAGDTVTLQVFVRDVTGGTGYSIKVKYDTVKVGSPTYAHGPLIAGAIALPAKVAGGVIEGGASILGGSPVSGSGLLATFTFKAKANFEGGSTLSVTSINLQMGTARKELVTGSLDAEVTADVPVKASNPANFTESGTVGFEDFFLFAGQFNTKVGDPNWDPRFDLNGDGVVGFEDFFIFAAAFGLSE